ncbi:MAG: hypothetical protein SVU24_10735 [Pseudomonadota bacterium]|nr:hypothetical protein [Pseudomonadota bacterium]
MRHFLLLAQAIMVLSGGMSKASLATALVTLPSLAQGFGAGNASATGAAIPVASITQATDHHLAATTGTVEQTST